MKITAYRTSRFRPGQSLIGFLKCYLPRLHERSIVVVTSKIVSLSEGRVVPCPNERAFDRLVRQESEWALKTKLTWLTIKDKTVMASAGIDRSNANGQCALLPKDSFQSASHIRWQLTSRHRLRRLGVVITDSRLTPLRHGVVGVALGYAGFKGLRDNRGKPDLFGRPLKMTQTNVADSLATAAVLMMGEGNEQRPLAVIEGAPVEFTSALRTDELHINLSDDIYAPLFQRLRKLP